MYHGVEHITSTVCALGPGYNLMKGELYENLLGVSCHELFHAWNVKTIRPIFALILSATLVLLWVAPILTSEGFDAGQFAMDLCLFMGVYLMLVCPDFFSGMARRKKFTGRALA